MPELHCSEHFEWENYLNTGCSKRLSSKAAASEEARRTLRYIEPLSDARTPLADFFSILLDFLDVYVDSHHWPAFNAADSAISVGVVFLIIHFAFEKKDVPLLPQDLPPAS